MLTAQRHPTATNMVANPLLMASWASDTQAKGHPARQRPANVLPAQDCATTLQDLTYNYSMIGKKLQHGNFCRSAVK
jgi:hypothetical protein